MWLLPFIAHLQTLICCTQPWSYPGPHTDFFWFQGPTKPKVVYVFFSLVSDSLVVKFCFFPDIQSWDISKSNLIPFVFFLETVFFTMFTGVSCDAVHVFCLDQGTGGLRWCSGGRVGISAIFQFTETWPNHLWIAQVIAISLSYVTNVSNLSGQNFIAGHIWLSRITLEFNHH